ncbi:glycosyltransferase family 87 protein [Actinomycetota bacterium]
MLAHGVLPFGLVFAMVTIGIVFLVPGLVVSVTEDAQLPVSERGYGEDLRAFTSAGEIAAARDGASLYDPMAEPYVASGSARFVNPPWYAIAMIPLSWIPFDVLWPLWTIVGVVAMFAGLCHLGLTRTEAWVGGALISLAGTLNLLYGQNTFFVVLVLAAGVVALAQGRDLAGGVAFGLLAFKPHLFFGFVIWWLVDARRRWRVIAAACVTVGFLAGASAIWLPGAWVGFFESLASAEELVVPEREVTLISSVRLAVGPNLPAVWALSALLIMLVIASLIVGIRRLDGDVRVSSALAIIASLLIALHALPYDWLLLMVAIGLLATSGLATVTELTIAGATLAIAELVGLMVTDAQLEAFDRAIHIAPLVLLAFFAVAVARTARSDTREMPPVAP